MDFKISSERIANPLLVELLRRLTDSFRRMNREFYVIGATARDIMIQLLVGTASGRKTRDLDIAIAIPDWSVFDEIKENLVADGFGKSLHMHQRFYYGDYELDIVPFGVAKDDDNIYWPPDEEIAMSVKGFDEVMSKTITVSINGEFEIRIVSLQGLFVLKFNAWMDRNLETGKDAEDMSFILSNYFIANIGRNIHSEVYDREDFNEYIAGGYWLAHDLLNLLSKEQIDFYKDCIEKELEKGDESRLLNRILEQSHGLKYETVRGAWQTIADVLGSAR